MTSYNNGAGTPAEVWTYKHDAFGREVEVRQTRGAVVRVVTNAYDGEGRLIRQSSPEGIVNYEYDDLGRKTRTYTGTAANPISDYRYSYDSLGRLATVEARERNNVTLSPSEVTSYTYDLVGNLDLQRQANGSIVNYVYDSLNRLDILTQYAPDATPNDLSDNAKIADFDYTVRADGKRTAATERIWKDGPSQGPLINQLAWTYDDVGRLTQEVLDSSGNSLDYTTRYKFDLAGNRVEKRIDQSSNATIDQFFAYAYDADDRLLTESLDNGMDAIIDQITTYGWGVNNLGTQQTSKTVHDQATNLDTTRVSYTYNLQGRMEVVTTETLTAGSVSRREKVTFDYDDTGIRVSALDEIDANADGTFETRTLTEYLIDPQNFTGYQQVLTETAKNADTGEIQKVIDYTIGQDLIAQTTTDYINGVPQTPVTLSFGYDGHGSTRVLTDLTGAIAVVAGIPQIFHYDAYGNAVGFNPALAATTYLYSGEQWDQHVAMQYLRARFYDPAIGRFNRVDPFFGNATSPQGFNKYAYTLADPTNFIDPSGLFETTEVEVNIEVQVSVGAKIGSGIVGTAAVIQALERSVAQAELQSTAAELGARVGTLRDIEELDEEGKRYFIHGSSIWSWLGVDVIDPTTGVVGENDFGLGFYTFQVTPRGIAAAIDRSRRKVDFWNPFDFAILIVVGVRNDDYNALSKLDFNQAQNLGSYEGYVNFYHSGAGNVPLGVFDVIIGPVAQRIPGTNVWTFLPALDQYPDQYAFKTWRAARALRPVLLVPVPPRVVRI